MHFWNNYPVSPIKLVKQDVLKFPSTLEFMFLWRNYPAGV